MSKVPCVDGSELARAFFTFAALVGAAMSLALATFVSNSVQLSGQAAQLFGVLDHIAQLWYNDAR
jgi:hypothetical protein